MAPGPGVAELAMLLAFLSGFGIPLGMPPEPEQPAMAHVAPAECLLYASWSGMAAAAPDSRNHTERLLAEPEIQQFGKSLETAIGQALRSRRSPYVGEEQPDELSKVVPIWARTVMTRSTAVFVEELEVSESSFSLRGGLIVDAGEQAASLVDALARSFAPEGKPKPQRITLGKASGYRFSDERGGDAHELTIAAAGRYVLVGVGAQSLEDMLTRLQAKQTPEWLTAIQKRLPLERRSSVSYVNTPQLREKLLPLAGPAGERIAHSLGLNEIGELIGVTGLDEKGVVSKSLLKFEKQPEGVLSLLDGPGLQASDLQALPKDAIFAAAISLSPEQAYELFHRVFVINTEYGEADFERFNMAIADRLGFRLKEDILDSLGDVWTLSASPADGLLGATLSVEVKEPKILAAAMRRATALYSESGDFSLRTTSKFGDYELHTIAPRYAPVQPTWCVTESRMIVGLTPQAVKGALSLNKSEQGLLEQHEPLAQALQGEDRVIAITYRDSPELFAAVYGYVPLVAPQLALETGGWSRYGNNPLAWSSTQLPSARSIHRHLQPGATVTRRTTDGLETESHSTLPTPNIGATAPVALALLFPAVQSAREAATRTQSSNNVKQIMIALHNYHDTYRTFPPAYTFDRKNLKPGLSWRVMILPFIEQQNLFEQFRLDEPWDSEHNKKLIAKMPKVYRSPSSKAGEGKTVYLGVGGAKGIFAPPKPSADGRPARGVGMVDVVDGTSNTIAVVEASDESAVIWTKPDDVTPDPANPFQGLVGQQSSGVLVGLTDGSVRLISDKLAPEMLMRLFQRDDGHTVDFDAPSADRDREVPVRPR